MSAIPPASPGKKRTLPDISAPISGSQGGSVSPLGKAAGQPNSPWSLISSAKNVRAAGSTSSFSSSVSSRSFSLRGPPSAYGVRSHLPPVPGGWVSSSLITGPISRKSSEISIRHGGVERDNSSSAILAGNDKQDVLGADITGSKTAMTVRAASDRRPTMTKGQGNGLSHLPFGVQQGVLLPGLRAGTAPSIHGRKSLVPPLHSRTANNHVRGVMAALAHSENTRDQWQYARDKWKLAINAIRRLVRATSLFRLGPMASILPAFIQEENNNLAKKAIKPPEAVAKSKIHLLLSKPRGLRTNADFAVVDPYLVKLLPCLQRLSSAQRKQMYLGSLSYEVHPPRTMILRDSGTAESVYFVLSGSVEVYKDHRGVRLKQNLVGPGGIVGDVSAHHLLAGSGTKRFMNVICLGFCEFLRMDLDEYVHIMFGHDGSNIDNLVSLLNSHPIFQNAYETTLLKAAQNSVLGTFPAGSTIISQDEVAERIFVLCKGTARAVRGVPFVRTHTVQTGAGTVIPQQVIQPFSGDRDPKTGEELFVEEVFVSNIGPGGTFPALTLPVGMTLDPTKAKTAEFWPRSQPAPQPNPIPNQVPAPSRTITFQQDPVPLNFADITVYAETEVQCAVFTVEAFLKLATNEMVDYVLQQSKEFKIPVEALQEQYLRELRAGLGSDAARLSGELGGGVSILMPEGRRAVK
ncbi:uncharacterized protein SPPG_02317 [Spizellomyces punctatus DAOM BR117]|uniref:Cyclic nucleotide-binding domain-containing protein n=1 Tax=Spizellomyces punctatus (strain DAOM BR117) TaxID=645134 RepID=A0A0L0HQ78_SPIPD|nr:uncharacterized protein SPPG_02317 [Spizellomyces punctatus DAOM BR117]KND03267.1 hypothetical protein SPPG_02317 [Spizellomyces punctatus DAOM BR117]|eukprot:XP_016611306.1 hypothetical protein SPPG_02317 [Spizellomyces punctatus DAOM BR117]